MHAVRRRKPIAKIL